MVEVVLTEEQVLQAVKVGVRRHMEAIKRKLPDKHGMRAIDGLSSHINGACGELAASIALELQWDGSVNVFKVPDVDQVYVRTRSEHWHDLIIRENDPPGIYLLVTGLVPTFRVHGACLGENAWMRPELIKEHGGREPACFVPARMLGSIDKLKTILGRSKPPCSN